MKRKAISGIMLALLTMSMLTLTFNVERAKATQRLVPLLDTFTTVMEPNTGGWGGPFVISDAGLYKMWYGTGSGIVYAESDNGTTWSIKQTFHDCSGYYRTGDPYIIKEGGTYLMWHRDYYESVDGEWSSYIAHMTSTDGVSWPAFMSADDQKVLSAQGQDGVPQGDGYCTYAPCVINESTGYVMWYSVGDLHVLGGAGKIWRATSTDGIAWTNRQLSLPYVPNTWESDVCHASVVKEDDGTYTMFYWAGQWNGSLGVAQSADGISWTDRTQWLKPSDLGANIAWIGEPCHFKDVDGKRYLYFDYWDSSDGIGKFGRIQLGPSETFDWPMVGYNAACTGFSPSLAPNTNGTAWVSNLPGGTAWSYPVVAGDRVFIGAGGMENAFSEKTGDLVWNFSAPGQPGYPCCSAVADGIVYFGTGEPGPGGCMYALNATTGNQLWNFTTELYLRGPVVAEGRLYFGVDTNDPTTGKIYCLNATTGNQLWNFTTQDWGVSVAIAHGKVYAGCGHWQTAATGCIYCLDMYDGSLFWSFQTNRDITGSVSVADGMVFFSASYEGSNCAVFALNATDGNPVWSVTRYSNGDAARNAVAYGKVFVNFGYGAKGIYALNETNGDEIWAFPITYGVGGGPVVADGKVFFAGGYPSHTFYALNEKNGAIVWTYELEGGVHSWSSAIANSHVFVADHWAGKLCCFGEPAGLVHDVAVTDAKTSKTGCLPMATVGQFLNVNVTVTVVNNGTANESSVNITAYATPSSLPPIIVGTTTVSLDAGASVTVTFVWNAAASYGNHTISATAGPVAGETNTGDNTLSDGTLLITIPGDINGDLKVSLSDLVLLASAYSSRPGDVKWNPNADINGDGKVSLQDLVTMAVHYGQHYP
jgi:outer membrane protein assembly factor BamB